ncbi:recoverin 2 isoform X2 [Embiotoca jacksoni]|uniref:recoverin 2 isoform X2 n=1 Tax=Embiotoca jacksoni TaxID=100190 RepID=UPI003703A151
MVPQPHSYAADADESSPKSEGQHTGSTRQFHAPSHHSDARHGDHSLRDAKSYARHVFRSFDTNDDGTLDFKEYIIALHMTSTGKTTQKLEWAFSLFDVDKNGYINKTEVTELCQAIFKLIPKEDQSKLPEDENTPEKRANKLWAYFEKKDNERLAEGEFIKGLIENENAMCLIHYEPMKQQSFLFIPSPSGFC